MRHKTDRIYFGKTTLKRRFSFSARPMVKKTSLFNININNSYIVKNEYHGLGIFNILSLIKYSSFMDCFNLTRVEKLKKVQSYAVRINTDPPIILSPKVFLFRNRLDTSLIGGKITKCLYKTIIIWYRTFYKTFIFIMNKIQ